uniref:Secreted protein n=1 Tax=Cacopsylla melanoneura TaxID=428564 RepID=A0A8D9AH43_9HEMI
MPSRLHLPTMLLRLHLLPNHITLTQGHCRGEACLPNTASMHQATPTRCPVRPLLIPRPSTHIPPATTRISARPRDNQPGTEGRAINCSPTSTLCRRSGNIRARLYECM